ncbi:MAG: TonB-dependent receptor [Pseudomonadota bacterium]
MKTSKTMSFMLAISLPAMAQAAAATVEQPTVPMEEMVVTASRVGESVKEVSASMLVISPEEIAASPARNVGELLAEQGLGSIKQYPGALTTLDIRGFKSESYGNDLKSHVLVLLNGRRAGTGNVAKIMTANVERIEIIRGPGSVQYGSAAMGGVVNVITRKGSGAPSVKANATIGSYGYDETGLLLGGEHANVDFSGSFSRSTMDDYETGSGDGFRNSGYDHIDAYSINTGYTFAPSNRIGVIFNRYYGDEIGSPGYISSNDLDNSKDTANHSMDFIYDGANEDQSRSWQLRYFSGKDKDTWHDPITSNAGGWDDDTSDWNSTDFDGAQTQGSMEIGIFRLTAGIDWLQYETTSTFDPTETTYENYAGFLLAQAKLLEKKLIINTGVRHDTYEVEVVDPVGRKEKDDNLSTTLGMVYLINNEFKLRAHYGEAFIMPGANELAADFVSDFGVHYVGNSSLDPESSKTYEAGVDYSAGGISASLGYFHTRFKDKIESTAADFGQTWENVGKARISGFEANASCDLGARFGWSYEVRPYINMVYLDRYEDLDSHEELKYISDLNGSYGISVSDYDSLSARLNFSYRGEQTIDDWESGAFPAPIINSGGFTVADLTMSKKVLDFQEYGSFTLTGKITNLFDTDYAYVKGYPMPGRMFYAGLSFLY